ncbi:acetyl-CoA synthetase-like protein [Hortaea werneckii]|nr:acetyl-CoA synthetase-like protein [Hortaea werneckii]KAI7109525.1 acetyl-CoA synthetase-like protein [Hortaea werneckii]KAI7245094.1 acetyl-CoA synthetase-like protein [Hortaea werneckii]KAI7339543.1 acetyl-CoA synthetase-like protein [Hortaea werneckii]KAI7403493.1 acetyl-CoA synthetase-like protein [Hortaea werneckii]
MAAVLNSNHTSIFGDKEGLSITRVEAVESETVSPSDLEFRFPRTIDELIRLRARQSNCNEPVIAYPNEGTEYVDYTPLDLDSLVETAASYYSALVPQRITSDDPVQVVGLLGDSDLNYLISFLAISRLGHSALLLSTRITPEAYESLLLSTKAAAILCHESFGEQRQKIQGAIPALKAGSICDAERLPSAGSLQPSVLDLERETHNVSFIIHSSGSTGLPKPIYQTHQASLYSYSQNFGLVGHITLPLYHNHGISCLFRAIFSRRKIYIYNARLPLASRHLLATLKQHPDIRILYGVPYALKLLNETDEGMNLLSKLDIVMFGGSACPKPIGDRLVHHGVHLVAHYGATEVGQLMTSFRDYKEDKDWDWLRVPENLKPYLRMEERGPNLFELCVRDGWKSKVATNRDDGSYATKDLFQPHPTRENAWQYYARLDDTLVLENGEKANPLLIEGVIRQNPHVGEVVVFGNNKPRLGAFVMPAATSKLPNDQILDLLMPTVLEMNSESPAYAQLSKDMIKILPRNAVYRTTDKGTVIRAAFYKDFASEIDTMYVDQQSGSLILSKQELLETLKKELTSKLPANRSGRMSDDTDLFSLGVDSLQAIQMRSFILKNLKLDAQKIGRNFIFDFPNLNAMADEILRLQTGQPETEKLTVEDRMARMIDKYAHFEPHTPIDRPADGKYIVVTGATGSLGAHVVAQLAAQISVRKVYCLVRASNPESAKNRVRQSLIERRLYHMLPASSHTKIEALPSSLGATMLGLNPQTYQNLAEEVTHTLHLAWSVNFNMGLESFEADCIAGARNLIQLCLHAQRPQAASFNFCSSVSATARTPGGVIPEGLPASLEYAQGMGYAQSKLVAEHLCDRAAKQTGIRARVLRVGQIIGDSCHGVWNATEAIPMIFQTAKTIGALPKLDENPAWLPVDTVANAFTEISCSGADAGVMNIVNHRTFHWSRDLLPLLRSTGLQFEDVGQREWIDRLRRSNPDPVANPPIKLVDFFASKYDNDEPKASSRYVNDTAQQHSPSLQDAPIIDTRSVKQIISYLESVWTPPATKSTPLAIVIGGPCGTGKSTVATSIAERLRLPVIEGDVLHSQTARNQMSQQIALTDSDRLSWLAHIRGAVMDRAVTSNARAIIATCSALRGTYRDELRMLQSIAGIRTLFIMLSIEETEELTRRVEMRKDHYMTSAMVDSQVRTLEAPREDETDIVPVNAARSVEEVVDEVQAVIEAALA